MVKIIFSLEVEEELVLLIYLWFIAALDQMKYLSLVS